MSEGIAILHSYDPATEESSTDVFRESDETDVPSPWHRAHSLRGSVAEDFPDRIWSVGQNERSHVLMTTHNMHNLGMNEWTHKESLAVIVRSTNG